MSNISSDTINKVAKLANIKISEEEREQFSTHLTKVTNWVGSLNEVNTEGVAVLNNVHNMNLTLFPDEVVKTNNVEELLKNAPDAKFNYFAVPKVIE